MSGALAERDFVRKLQKAGFEEIEVVARDPWGIEECALYPLFDEDLIGLMTRVIPEEDQQHVGDSVVIRASLPAGSTTGASVLD